MILEQITELECKRCGHKWIPRKKEVRYCPHCQSAYWDTPREKPQDPPELECLRCGHKWTAKNEHPKHCPKCGSAYWDRPRKKG